MKNQFSLTEVSTMLNCSKDTLRYYDRVGLVSPKRKGNNYRVYSVQDIHKLKTIQVLKYSGLSLEKIRIILKNKECDGTNKKAFNQSMEILSHQEKKIKEKIKFYTKMIVLFERSKGVLNEKYNPQGEEIDQLIERIYEEIEEEK